MKQKKYWVVVLRFFFKNALVLIRAIILVPAPPLADLQNEELKDIILKQKSFPNPMVLNF